MDVAAPGSGTDGNHFHGRRSGDRGGEGRPLSVFRGNPCPTSVGAARSGARWTVGCPTTPVSFECPGKVMREGWAAADDRFAHRTLLGREGGRLRRRRPVVSERGPAAAPLRPIPAASRDYSRKRESIPRTSRQRPAHRGRRRHRSADLAGRGRPPLPGGGEPSRARERRRRPCELHRSRGGDDRDEHVRREPPQARARAPRRVLRADQLRGRSARAGGARGRRARCLRGRIDRPARRARGVRRRGARAAVRGAGAGARGTWCRPVHGRDVLRPRGARRRGRCGARGLVASDRRVADVRRRGRGDRRRRRGGRREPARRARRRGDRDEPRRRADGGAEGPPRDARRGPPACGASQHRPREPRRRAGRLPPLDTRLLRRVRGAGGRSRRTDRGRLLGRRPPRSRPSARRSTRAASPERRSRSTSRSSLWRPPRQSRRPGSSAHSATANGSSRSSSIHRREARSTASWGSRARSGRRDTPATSTSTTTRWRERE